MLTEAGQPEILRASQRDETFKKQLSDNVSEILQLLGGIHFWIKYKDVAKLASNMLYQVMTTLLNLQTLGEEYTGMVQVDSSKNSLPRKYLQCLMIFLNNCGDKIVIDVLQKFEQKIENLPEDHPLQQHARQDFVKMSKALRTCLPFLEKFHKALFYFNGGYYEISKRLCGIKYVLVRYWLKDRSSISTYKILGIVSGLHIILNIILSTSTLKNISTMKEVNNFKTVSGSVDACDKCSLCLNVRENTSVTPCGHLFCWSCIIPWLQENPKCPLCRQSFKPSRVVFLQNFSNSK